MTTRQSSNHSSLLKSVIIGLLLCLPTVLTAQPTVNESASSESDFSETTTENKTVDQQLSVLSDTQARALLRAQLIKNNQQQQIDTTNSTVFVVIKESLANTLLAFQDAFIKVMNINKAYDQLAAIFSGEFKAPMSFFNAAMQLLMLVVLALSIELLFKKITRARTISLLLGNDTLKSGRFLSLGKIAFYRLVGAGIFYSACFLVLPYIFTQNSFLLTAYAFLDYTMIARLTYIGCAFFFAPKHPQLRLFNIDDTLASRLLSRLVIVSLFSALSIFVDLFKNLGIPQGLYKLGFWTSILSYIAMIVAVYLSRDGIKKMLLHTESGNSKQRILFANIWPTIVISCIVLVWLTLEIVVANVGFDDDIVYAATFTMLAILAVPFFDIAIITIVNTKNPSNTNQSKTQQKLNSSLKFSILRISRIMTFMSLVFVFSLLWGIDYLSLSTQGFAAIIITRVIEATILLLFGLISWEIVNVYIQRKLTKELPDSDEEAMDAEGGQGLSRSATLLPLIKNTIAFFIFILSIIGALSTLGFNTTALLAGAGVLGLAIGFGAQTLVKDIVSGVFFLIDDAFRMGEYVVIGSTMGSVEKIALRSLRLRHHLGALHTVPYGEIPSLTNYSRDWVIMKLRFRVPHDTDINKVKKLFKKLGKELLEHPELGKDFIEPFKSQGVLEVDEVGMLIRGKFTCKPGGQFMIRKQVYLRVQQIFAENNIEFAKRKVEVQLPKDVPPSLMAPLSAAAAEISVAASTPVIVPPTT